MSCISQQLVQLSEIPAAKAIVIAHQDLERIASRRKTKRSSERCIYGETHDGRSFHVRDSIEVEARDTLPNAQICILYLFLSVRLMVADIRPLPPLMRLKIESWKLVQVDHVEANHERKVEVHIAADGQKGGWYRVRPWMA